MEKDIVATSIKKVEKHEKGIIKAMSLLLTSRDMDVYDWLSSDINKLADAIKRKAIESWET